MSKGSRIRSLRDTTMITSTLPHLQSSEKDEPSAPTEESLSSSGTTPICAATTTTTTTTVPTTNASAPPTATTAAVYGDIVTVDLDLTPEGDFVPEGLFDTTGRITFVLGWGNYLPGLHQLVTGMAIGDHVKDVSIDAGFGQRNTDLILEVPKTRLKKIKTMDRIIPGATLNLQGNVQVLVIGVTDDTIIVDANHPLAGSSYSCSVRVVNIESFPTHKLLYDAETADNYHMNDAVTDEASAATTSTTLPSPYHIATVAMGCFWGGELAFMRTPGVVGTRVGYTQGVLVDPSYEDVCEGTTLHREAVMVVYDSRVVTYRQLLDVYWERLAATTSQYKIDPFAEEHESDQYRHGIYYHNDNQRRTATDAVDNTTGHYYHRYNVELLQATVLYDAEEYHQQYLYKGGQSARKGARETIRCFG